MTQRGYLRESMADLFISYRRVANEGDDEWVAGFCKALSQKLREMVGEVGIWRDQPSMRIGDWEAQAAEALQNAAVFLAVISRTYFDAHECRLEFNEFMARCTDPRQPSRPVLVPIFKQPPKDDPPLPVEIKKVNHPHAFFQLDEIDSHRWREIGPSDNERDFRSTIARLAQDLTMVLEDMKGLARRQSRGKVFLAAGVGRHLDTQREELRSEIVQHGFHVVPEHEYMWNTAGTAQQIADDMHGACLCVHMVARHEPSRADEPLHVREQLDQAQQAMNIAGGPPLLVWVQPAKVTAPAMQSVVDHVINVLTNTQGVDCWEKSVDEFRSEVVNRLSTTTRLQEAVANLSANGSHSVQPSQAKVAAPGPRKLLLLADESEIDTVQTALAGPLTEVHGIEPRIVSLSGAQPKDALRLMRDLAGGAACVIYWGGQPLDWLQDVLDIPMLGVGRERLAVYVDAPLQPGKASLASKRATVIAALQRPEPTAVAAFAKSAGVQ